MSASERWTIVAKTALTAGQPIEITPTGESMAGLVSSGDTVALAPCDPESICIGDIVLVEIQGRRFSHIVLHLVKAITDGRFLIGANNGRIDGWVTAEKIFGRVNLIADLEEIGYPIASDEYQA